MYPTHHRKLIPILRDETLRYFPEKYIKICVVIVVERGIRSQNYGEMGWRQDIEQGLFFFFFCQMFAIFDDFSK